MISVVILNFNGMRYLDRCLSSLQDQTYPDLEVILVDNASTDGSEKYAKASYPWLIVVTLTPRIWGIEGAPHR
ncbi:Glycosyltransferase AglE [uncultured archaeon]|nr:Glycosyltransferase AglE [uncultured archaeon]